MKQKSNLILTILILLFLTNCTIQKRTFNKGYFVQWNNQHKSVSPIKAIEETTSNEFISENEVVLNEKYGLEIIESEDNFYEKTEKKVFTEPVFINSFHYIKPFIKSSKLFVEPKFKLTNKKNKERLVNKDKIYFDKERGRKALIYSGISLFFLVLFYVFYGLMVYNFINFSLLLFFLLYIFELMMYAALILALIYFIFSFFKRKEKNS